MQSWTHEGCAPNRQQPTRHTDIQAQTYTHTHTHTHTYAHTREHIIYTLTMTDIPDTSNIRKLVISRWKACPRIGSAIARIIPCKAPLSGAHDSCLGSGDAVFEHIFRPSMLTKFEQRRDRRIGMVIDITPSPHGQLYRPDAFTVDEKQTVVYSKLIWKLRPNTATSATATLAKHSKDDTKDKPKAKRKSLAERTREKRAREAAAAAAAAANGESSSSSSASSSSASSSSSRSTSTPFDDAETRAKNREAAMAVVRKAQEQKASHNDGTADMSGGLPLKIIRDTNDSDTAIAAAGGGGVTAVTLVNVPQAELRLPSSKMISTFVATARQFLEAHSDMYLAVHGLYGYNMCGAMIVCYLVEALDYDPASALTAFAQARAPGIYSRALISDIFERYGGQPPSPIASMTLRHPWIPKPKPRPPVPVMTAPTLKRKAAPSVPLFPGTSSAPSNALHSPAKRPRMAAPPLISSMPQGPLTSEPAFPPPFVIRVKSPHLERLQQAAKQLVKDLTSNLYVQVGEHKSQATLTQGILKTMSASSFMVSWKTCGKRLLMLILREGSFLLPNSTEVFHIPNLRFSVKHAKEWVDK
jgi:hypothetical protein